MATPIPATEIEKPVKPKEEIIHLEPQVRLGSLAIQNPADVIARGAEFAKALADVINTQNLYKNISNKKYVMYEGWVTLGALLGVLPEEEYCRQLADGSGYEAKIRLFRTSDGQTCGAASAECTRAETRWKTADSYAIRSMAITRATGKAFRLSFSWIMKLAGYEVTPAEEMKEDMSSWGDSGSREAAQEVARKKIEDHNKTKPIQHATTLFYTYPEKHNGHIAEFVNVREFAAGLNPMAAEGLTKVFAPFLSKALAKSSSTYISRENVQPLLEKLVGECGIDVKELRPNRREPGED